MRVPTGEVSFAANMITDALGARAEFGSIGVSDNGDGLILYWHGALPASVLNDVEASYPEVLIEMRPTKYLPGDLRDATHRLVQTEADAGVGAAVPSTDGSGILALVHEDKVREDLAKLAARLSSETGFPVTVETGAPVPA